MQTATLKEVTAKLGISLDDVVYYHTLSNRAFIQIELNLPPSPAVDYTEPTKSEGQLTPEEEFRRKYPDIEVEPEFFKLVGCMAQSTRSDKDELLDAIEEKYR